MSDPKCNTCGRVRGLVDVDHGFKCPECGNVTLKPVIDLATAALPCIRCDKPLKAACGGPTNQPSEGLSFTTGGHYGSTVFDMRGGYLDISVCDACVAECAAKGMVARVYATKPLVEFTVTKFDPRDE